MVKCRPLLGIFALLLAACSGIPAQTITSTPPAAATPTPGSTPTSEVSPTPPVPAALDVWVPPQFAPSGTPAGKILQARLDAFVAQHPDLRIQVRIKPVDGPGGLLDSLTTSSAAAPLALPDLVALPRPLMETAALKGLLHPFGGLIADPEDSDWFDYALRLAHLQDSLFGLPFSGDALVLVYRSEIISQPPATMAQVLQSSGALAFPAADPQALFTLALYQAEGGEVLDGEGRPILQEQPLTRVLTALLEGAQSERLPFWLTQFQSDDQAWEAFQRGQADMVITWSSRFLHTRPEGASMALLPTLDGAAFTLATGWMWALAGPSPESQEAAAQLAEFLSESDFLGEWTETTGYLPPHPRALSDWQDSQLRTFIRQVSLSAHLVPSADVLPGLAAPLVEATAEMLKLENDPATAAREAVESLQAP